MFLSTYIPKEGISIQLMKLSLTLQNNFISPVLGFFSRTDILFRTESKGRTFRSSNSTFPSPGRETWMEDGDLFVNLKL